MNQLTAIRALGSILTFTLITACGQHKSSDADATRGVATTEGHQAPALSAYAAALANELRPQSDLSIDAARKPAEVLEFIGIEPGMSVLDMFSGGGWYAEIIAHVVGERGHVIAHSNEAYKGFVGDALQERFASGRVAQAKILMAENNQLALEEDSLDAIMLSLSFHDIYHVDEEGGWALINGPALLAELKKGLRPGGIVGIVDHAATAGSPPETGDSLHRIDPARVVADMEAAGFICEASSDILGNSEDDLSEIVFAEGIRGKTDRFVMRFRNPK